MNITEHIESALSLIKAGFEIAKSGGDPATVITDLKERLLSLQKELLSVKNEALAINKELLDAKERLMKFENFDRERDRYTLARLDNGSLVYVIKPGTEVDDPLYYLCAYCFDRSIHTKLKLAEQDLGHDIYKCHECGATVLVPNDREAEIEIVPTTTRWPDY